MTALLSVLLAFQSLGGAVTAPIPDKPPPTSWKLADLNALYRRLPALHVHTVDPTLPGWPEAARSAISGLGGWSRLRRATAVESYHGKVGWRRP